MISGAPVARFVVEVPEDDARIVGEMGEDAFDIAFQARPLREIVCRAVAGGLDPAGVVTSRNRFGLFAELEIRFPAVVKEDEHRLDLPAVGDFEVGFHSFQESGGILFPEQVVQIDPHKVHADAGGVAEFPADRLRIERFLLPHFQLIDCGGGGEVCAPVPDVIPDEFSHIGLFAFFCLIVSGRFSEINIK